MGDNGQPDPLDPELLAAFTIAGLNSNVPEFNAVAQAAGEWMGRVLDQFEAEHQPAAEEFMRRCVKLVQTRGTSIWAPKQIEESRGAKKEYIRYVDSRFFMEYQPDGPCTLNIRSADRMVFYGSSSGVGDGRKDTVKVCGQRLQDLLAYLREIMVLDDISEAI